MLKVMLCSQGTRDRMRGNGLHQGRFRLDIRDIKENFFPKRAVKH